MTFKRTKDHLVCSMLVMICVFLFFAITPTAFAGPNEFAGCSLDMDSSTKTYTQDTVDQTGIEATITAAANDTMVVFLVAQDVTDMTAFSLNVNYDSSRLTFDGGAKEIIPGTKNFLESNGGTLQVFQATDSSPAGTINVVGAIAGSGGEYVNQVTGSGIIAILYFTLQDGNDNNNLTLSDISFSSNAGGAGTANVLDTITTVNNGGFNVNQTVSAPTVSSVDATDLADTSATLNGNITDDGGASITERGFCYGTSNDPETTGTCSAEGGIATGTFSAGVSGLTACTTYFFKAYATNSEGTSYGSELNFTTTGCSGGPNANAGCSIDMDSSTKTYTQDAVDQAGIEATITAAASDTMVVFLVAQDVTDMTAFSLDVTYDSSRLSFDGGAKEIIPGTKNFLESNGGTLQVFQATDSSPAGTINVVGAIAGSGGEYVNQVTGSGIIAILYFTLQDGNDNNMLSLGNVDFSSNAGGAGTANVIDSITNLTDGGFNVTSTVTTPTVSTTAASNVATTSADVGGDVTADGGATVTERGVYYGTAADPVANGTKMAAATAGTGAFTINLTGLTADTQYYFVAYATNSEGTAYGSELNFTTQATSVTTPTVSTTAASNISSSSADVGGDVTADGGATVTERGVYYGTSTDPVANGTKMAAATAGTGAFTINLTGLSADTQYYFVAYATNSEGTAYGSELNFTTTSTAVTTPSVSTSAASSVTMTSANLNGNVTADGGATVTERGVYYGTTTDPVTNGTKAAAASGGTGTFSVSVSGLTANTQYYFVAYATNSEGTSYGSEMTFTTLSEQPTDCGDGNGDSVVNIYDALMAAEAAAEMRTLTADQITALNVDNTGTSAGVVDIYDALKIAKYDANMITLAELCGN